jgi:hypothetical protein
VETTHAEKMRQEAKQEPVNPLNDGQESAQNQALSHYFPLSPTLTAASTAKT